jgi:hypothetical protein
MAFLVVLESMTPADTSTPSGWFSACGPALPPGSTGSTAIEELPLPVADRRFGLRQGQQWPLYEDRWPG